MKYRVGMSLVPFWEEQLDDGGPCKFIREDPILFLVSKKVET